MDSDFSNLNKTNLTLLISLFAFNFGYFFSFKIISFKRKGFKILDFTQPNEIFFLALLFIISPIILFDIIGIQYLKPGLMMLKYPIMYMAIGLITFYIAHHNIKQNRYKTSILLILFSYVIFHQLIGSSLTFSFLLVASSFTYILFVNKKLNIFLLALVIFIMFILETYKDDYRENMKLEVSTMVSKKLFKDNKKMITETTKLIIDNTEPENLTNDHVIEQLISLTNLPPYLIKTINKKIITETKKIIIDNTEPENLTNDYVIEQLTILTNLPPKLIKTIEDQKSPEDEYEAFYDVYIKKVYSDLTQKNNTELKIIMSGSTKRFFHSYLSLNLIIENTIEDEEVRNLKQIIKEGVVRKVEYMRGDSYKLLLTGLIPRFLWKDKPQDLFAHDMGVRYGILSSNDKVTSWNVPIITEMYINFGKIGVVLGMLILGLSTRLLTLIFTVRNKLNYESIVGFFCLVPLFFIEVNSSMLFGAFIKNYIFLMVIMVSYCFLKKIKATINNK